MADQLAVWLYGARVALIERDSHGRPRLSYTAEAFDRYPLGSPLLSVSLPLASQAYTQGAVRPFIDGLLPEAESRRAVAAEFDLLASDSYGLIRALGRDCAGALVIQPAAEPAPPPPTTSTAQRVTDEELAELVAGLRDAPLGVTDRVRVSLAGVQEKLLMTRMPDGSWGRPVDGTPSTHILKPDIARFPDTVANEAFCMRLAKHLGLAVAEVDEIVVNGRRLLVVERYDRVVEPGGAVSRLHQEDFCQATGVPPEKKYQEDGGPSLLRVAQILMAVGSSDVLEQLLRAVVLNALVGNGDAHAKNFSMLHHRSGTIGLAPLYDVMSTLLYKDDRLAMYVDDVRRTDRVTADRIVKEAGHWGMRLRRSTEVVSDLLERVPEAMAAAQKDTGDLPPQIPEFVERQLNGLRSA